MVFINIINHMLLYWIFYIYNNFIKLINFRIDFLKFILWIVKKLIELTKFYKFWGILTQRVC